MNNNDPLNPHWRFSTHTNGSYMGEPVTVVTRGRAYRLPGDWTADSWRDYWDGDGTVCVINGYSRDGWYASTEGAWTERALHAIQMCREFDQDVDAMLTRLARRLTGNWASKFIVVGLDRGLDAYVLHYGVEGEHSQRWRDEIEAAYHGDIWRIEVQEYQHDHWGPGKPTWTEVDDVCDEWYGEGVAAAAFEAEFPLTEFPAELFTSQSA